MSTLECAGQIGCPINRHAGYEDMVLAHTVVGAWPEKWLNPTSAETEIGSFERDSGASVRRAPKQGGRIASLSWRIQLVNATDSLNISAGVLKPSVFRGLSFNCLAIALSFSCE